MAKSKLQNTSNALPGTFDGQLTEDVTGFHKNPNQWTKARNAVTNTIVGDVGELSNEASNRLATTVKDAFLIIGAIHIGGSEWVIFSTDGIEGEIGVFDEDELNPLNMYTTVVRSPCLNFNAEDLIKGVGRTAYDCGRRVYWDDGVNPSRTLDVDDIPWVQVCDDTDCHACVDQLPLTLDCDKLRLAPFMDDLAFYVATGSSSGEMVNGSYYVVGAYLVEGQRVGDYSRPSNVQGIFNHSGIAGALDITVVAADRRFEEFELILIQFANFNTVAKRVGVYSTQQKTITLDNMSKKWADIDISLFLLNTPIPDKSDAMFRAGPYLLRVGPTNKFDFNYQPLANQIKTRWVSIRQPATYYRRGGSSVGYMRDETYAYFIHWLYDTGDKSKAYHLPGRALNAGEDDSITGSDVMPGDNFPGEPVKKWQVRNTASEDPTSDPLVGQILPDGGEVIAVGQMAYTESSERYPVNKPNIWDSSYTDADGVNIGGTAGMGLSDYDLCGKRIRHHKFPDNDLSPRTHHYTTNGENIIVMGVVFENIKRPLDNNGDPIMNIVGYEILRGSREGNKTVLAKGMLNNLRQYETKDGSSSTFLYPNYPYNPKEPDSSYGGKVVDHFLSEDHTTYDTCDVNFTNWTCTDGLNNWNAYLDAGDVPLGSNAASTNVGNLRRDMLTFHSPDTNFRDPFLTAKNIKVYGELTGKMVGKFEIPKGHPRHKVITGFTFFIATIIGIGYAMMSSEGKKTRSNVSPTIDHGGTGAFYGMAGVGGIGMASVAAPGAMLQSGTIIASRAAELGIALGLDNSIISLPLDLFGIDTEQIMSLAKNISGQIVGTIGGAGNTPGVATEQTPWSATPAFIKLVGGIPHFLSIWAEGSDTFMDVVLAFSNFRQFALQQVSHGFYDEFEEGLNGNRRRHIIRQSYLGSNMQDFGPSITINNLFRSRTVALELEEILQLPNEEDDSQANYSDAFGRTNIEFWRHGSVLTRTFERPIASHYAALKQRLHNQYGQMDGVMQVPVSTFTVVPSDYSDSSGILYTMDNIPPSPIQFNGDTYIGRYTEKNTMFFFYDWLNGQTDGTNFNYELYKMVPHPRFWLNTEKFDTGVFMSSVLSSVMGGGSPSIAGYGDAFAEADPEGDDCTCDNQSNCEYDITDVCENLDKAEQWELYVDFLTDCAKFLNVATTPGYNDDNGIVDPTDITEYPEYGPSECDASITPGCAECPDAEDLAFVYPPPPIHPYGGNIDYTAGEMLAHNSGPYYDRVQIAKQKQQHYLDRANDKKADLFESQVDTNDSGSGTWIDNILDNIVTPSDYYALDMHTDSNWAFVVKRAFFFLFVSGVRDFFVESEVNVDFRDWGNNEERHYDREHYSNLREMFNTDVIKNGNFMKYDYSLSISKLFNNYVSWNQLQHRNYNPEIAETCYVYRPKRVLYSLPQHLENQKDNWRVFLPLNYKDFNSRTVSIKAIGKNGALMLFENESPIQFQGVDSLETEGGTKITLGDGGLFSQPMQNLVNTEYPNEYGSCQDRLAVANTSMGLYFTSQNQGKIFQISGSGLREISASGMKWWFATYLPYVLTQNPVAFNDVPYDLEDNPVTGIGCQIIYDNKNQIVFFTKKDWKIKKEWETRLVYKGSNIFTVNGMLDVALGDDTYFEEASWTVSWDPKINQGQGGWIGHHDWYPDLTIPTKNTYITTKKDGLWVHADRCDSFCNFYGKDYPFEIEYTLLEPGSVSTLRSVMYLMETYVYKENCDDKFHVLDFNFDEAIIHNSEQCSGLLKLNLNPKNNVVELIEFPHVNFDSIDILFSKEEQKYRFNQFWDATDDRGEFNAAAQRPIFITAANGYIKVLNSNNLNYAKSPLERKKFRHYKHSVFLRRKVSGDKNIIVSMALQKNLLSSR